MLVVVTEVRIIDFGLALKVAEEEKVHSAAGTVYFRAPELLEDESEKSVTTGKVLFLISTRISSISDCV